MQSELHTSFTETDAQALYLDLIQPCLAVLDAKMKNAQRLFRKDDTRKVLGWIGSISVGLYTGFLTSNTLAGTAAFGAAKAGAGFLDVLMAKSDVKESIKDGKLHFHWRVSQLAGRSFIVVGSMWLRYRRKRSQTV